MMRNGRTRSPRALACIAAALVLAAGLRPAGAQQSGEATAPEAPIAEALAKLDAGDAKAAVALLEPWRDRQGVPTPVLALLGLAYVEAGQPAAALEVLTPLVQSEDADPGALYNAGRAALAVGDPAAADQHLERAHARAPGSPASRELGMLRGRTGRLTDCLTLLQPWAANHPDDTEARLTGAFCAIQLARAPDAEALLSDLPQDLARVRLLWGKLLLLKGDPYGAIDSLRPLLQQTREELHGIDLDARRTLAEAHSMVGEAAQAVELLKGYTDGRPSFALQLAQAQYQSGDLDAAIATLQPLAEQAIKLGEEELPAPLERLRGSIALEHGRLLVAAGRHADALPFLELATELAPDDKLGWQSLGQALAAAGRTEDAQAALQRFRDITHAEVPASVKDMQLERDVSDPTGRELREAMKLLGQDRPEEALAIARREAQLEGEDPRPRLLESRILLEIDQAEQALVAAEAAIAMAPDNADGYYQRGVVRLASKQLPAAEADLRRALEIAPEHVAAMNDLAVLLMEKGETEEARRLLERVLELRPGDQLAAANLARLDGS